MVKMSGLERLFRCCCGGDGDDETDSRIPYNRLDNPVSAVRPRNNENSFRDIANDLRESNSPAHSSLHDSQQNLPQRSRKEQAEEALNAIVDSTQHNIIDVTHLENIEVHSGEYISRQKKYEEAVKAHDQKLNGGKGAQSSATKPPGSTLGLTGQLLDDAGNRAADWMGRAPLSKSTVEAAHASAARMSAAVKASLEIKTTRPLIVYMDH